MKLSIIIVNYNVKYFIEQAIRTSISAAKNISHEIFVVDNHSVDGSQSMIKELFPGVKLIESKQNLGFAKANNLAIRQAKGEFILLLNPDTVVGENTFEECIHFMEQHADCGALTVKMLDGSGKLLLESKRGFPTPWAAFCKFSGLYKLVPSSEFFNQYYLGHLAYDEVQKIDVLPGAYIMVRKALVDKIGGLDEAYFMYGEDIDFSYQIKKAGYENYYLPEPHIIHYKGESTSKSSLNYVKSFYNAMIIFTNKYYGGIKRIGLLFLLKMAIVVQGVLSFLKHNFLSIFRPIIDGIILFFGIKWIAPLWSNYYYNQVDYFPVSIFKQNAILYSSLWIIVAFLYGYYDRISKWKDIPMMTFVGLILNLIIYSILPEDYRTSRVVIFLSAIFAFLYFGICNWFQSKINLRKSKISLGQTLHYLIIGDESDEQFVRSILDTNKVAYEISKRVDPNDRFSEVEIRELVKVLSIDEIIFSSEKFQTLEVLDYISKLGSIVSYKIISKNTQSLISSDSKNTKGELIHFNIPYRLTDIVYKRQKRIFDIAFSLLVFLCLPILLWLQKDKLQFVKNCWNVLNGNFSWVGYQVDKQEKYNLPKMKNNLIQVDSDHSKYQNEILEKYILSNYAQNYTIWSDFNLCLQNITQLDSK